MDVLKKSVVPKCIIAIAMSFVCVIIIQLCYGWLPEWINSPIRYSGGDEIQEYVKAKMMVETGWVWGTENLGAPFGNSMLDFSPVTMDVFNLLLMKGISLFTDNPFIIVNIVYVFSFVMICLVSYIVMCQLDINYYVAAMLSLVFAFMPYIFLRGVMHLVLSTYQFIPLSIWLCIKIYEDELFENCKASTRNVFTICACILIGLNGIAYYPFFTCVLLLVAGGAGMVKRRKCRTFFKGVACCFIITLTLIISLLPHLCYQIVNGKNYVVAKRSPAEAEYYGLKIMQLILPINKSSIQWLNSIQEEYSNAPLSNEGSEYLGIVGVIGLLLLLIGIIINRTMKDRKYSEKIEILQKINLVALLLGTVGGLGSVISFFITSSLRAYNRISIFIAYICILTVGCYISSILSKIKYLEKVILYIVFTTVCIISISNQVPKNINWNAENIQEEYKSDKDFVERIEDSVEEDCMVFQLPYHAYPESGPVNLMEDYDLFKPYLYSHYTRWSYGVTKGRMGSTWMESISSLPINQLLENLCYAGYGGIYVNREAYSTEEWEGIEQEIKNILQADPIVSKMGNLSFFSLEEYKKKLECGNDMWEEQVSQIFQKYPLGIVLGAVALEGDAETGQWIWLEDEAHIAVYNYGDVKLEKCYIEFDLTTYSSGEYWVEIDIDGKQEKYILNSSLHVEKEMDLNPGTNVIVIKTNAPQIYAPSDSRKLVLQLHDFSVEY